MHLDSEKNYYREGIESYNFERKKHYSLLGRLSFKVYYLSRKFIPEQSLLRYLLNITWFFQRFAHEQIYFQKNADNSKIDLLRPRNLQDIIATCEGYDSILDYGGGNGIASETLLSLGFRVTYSDHEIEAASKVASRLSKFENFSIVDPRELTDNLLVKFDVVILSHVLEHIEDRQSFLRRISTLCKIIHIEVPDLDSDPLNKVRQNLNLLLHKDDDHVVEYTLKSLEGELIAAGLSLGKIEVRDGCIVARCNTNYQFV